MLKFQVALNGLQAMVEFDGASLDEAIASLRKAGATFLSDFAEVAGKWTRIFPAN